ncbi:T-cell differentiation antigen CD6 isoform X1 [Acipenser oxyrinchus oxyrinchus]|uniref:T-cell differentiation antigen CD6 isoform X1 n=1 Tax=Acipenser oxyrinchus oxyrinchus TaxID=40147 RepID=A0AAD8LSH5_ACIOX|nr:T-cell differentiation antigen CD6 isoform X1 [Acipenser oxyrinchus oxyrinchus]
MEVLMLILMLSVAGSQSNYTSEYLNNSSEVTTAPTNTANQTEAPVTLFRLFGGESPCSGSLQVFYNETWVPAEVTPVWNISEATLVCEKLDCGKAFDVQPLQNPNSQMQHSQYNSGLLECNFGGPDLFNCTEAQKGYYINRTNVICRGHRAVRLAGGRDACAGRVEVWEEGFWGTVCDDWWDMKDGNVACAQVGCGFAVEVLSGGARQFGKGHGPILMDDMNCTGTERFLWECPVLKHSGDCGHKEDAGVICSEHKAIRLSGGLDRCSGRVEIHRNGSWGTVCDTVWGKDEGGVVCSMLGCGDQVQVSGFNNTFKHNTTLKWFYQCTTNVRSLWDCKEFANNPNLCKKSSAAAVVCSKSLGLPHITVTAEETWTTGTPTSAFILIEKTVTVVSLPVLGCFVLSLLLLLVMILYAVKFCKYKKRDMMSVQQTNSNIFITEKNDYQDDVNLIKVTTTKIPNNDNVNPKLEATQLVNDDSSFEADYEDYDFSVEPAATMSTFQNSLRNRTDNRSPRMSTIPMTTLAEEEFQYNPNTPIYSNPLILNEDFSSTSSGESYQNNEAVNCNTQFVEEFQYNPNTPIYSDPLILNEDFSSTSSGESYQNNEAVNCNTQFVEDFSRSSDCTPKSYVVEDGVSSPGDKDVPSPVWQLPPSQSETTMPQPHHWDQLHNRPIENTADSSSTSSGECYENVGRLNSKPQTIGVSENHQGNVCQDFSSNSDYDDIANYCH